LAPTSGEYPIFVSGIANMVDSVAIRKGAIAERPTPPPTGTISIQDACHEPRLLTCNSVNNSNVGLWQ
jgi:hypothetical protein